MIPGNELLLAVEVISPGSGSERTDRLRKVMEYAALGIPQYWLVEHTPHLSVQVLRLEGPAYMAEPVTGEGTTLTATVDADKPFSCSFDPADLLAL
jgi:Uma2 family endonuclease